MTTIKPTKLKKRSLEEARKINKTGRKSLDVLAQDPRIVEIWDEGEDGYWAQLADGYNNEGCSCLHEWRVADLLAARSRIEIGPTY